MRGGQSFGSFDGLGGGTGSTAFTPPTARLDAEQIFTFSGTGLAGASVTIEDCGTGKIASDNTFKCQPTLPGNKSVTVNGTLLDSKVFFDHPTRTGNPASRGIPSVKGVSLWNGNFHHEVVDMEVPGLGIPFVLSRSYNSYYWDKEKARGSVDNYQPWRFNWDLKIGYIGGDTTRLYAQREDGSGASFFKEGLVWYPIDQGSFDTLEGNHPADSLTTLTTRDGRLYVFMNPDQGGKLMMVKDRDGHTLTLHYDNANGKVSSVTDTVGRTFTFSYDSAHRLRQVADASNAAFKVQYTWEADNPPNNPNASPLLRERIASVTDLRGKTTSYHYDPFTATNPDIGPRIFLTRIDDPRTNHPVTLTYTDTVYGDWGVASLTDAVNSTWRFKFCAENSGNPCGTLDKTIGFRSDVTAPAPFTASGFSAHFDTAGRYTGKTDGRQNTSVVTPYPTANLLSTNYGLAGLKAASQTARNNQTHHAYTPEGNEQSRTQADSGVLKKTWVKAAAANLYKLTASTSPAGVLRTMDYDATGKLTSHRVASLPASTQSYDPVTQLLKQSTDPLGNPTAYTYDAQGNLLTSTDALNQVTQHQYDSQGRVTRSIDPAGVITETSYDNAGNVLKETVDPSGLNLQTQYQYDENGNQTKHTDPLGNVTTTVYDAANRVQSVTRLVGGVAVTTRNAYDALGRVSSVTNANGHTSTTTFDDAGNVSTRSDALPRTTRYTYDEDNRVATVTDPEGRVTSTDYDPMGRVSKITTPDGSVSSTYDLDGRLATQTDKRGLVTSYEYDAAGRKNKVTDPKGGVTRMTYYDDGSLKTVADPNGNATTYEVDALGRRTRLLDAKGRAWTTSYDPAGNVKTTSDPAGNSATRSYDTANRLKSIAWSDGTFVNYTLDKNGNHTQVVDNTGTTTYVYDEMDRIKSATNPNGQTVSYAYDGLGNVTTLGYPGGRNVGYRYDVVERMAGLTDWGGRSTNYTLDKSDRVTQIAHGNGATTGMSYDPAGRLQSLTSRKPDNSVLAAHTLTRDANGNITKNDVQLPLEPSFVSGNRALAVDTDNRQTALSYDAAGRVTNNGSFALGWNARDQLISIGSDSQTYNAEGVRVAQTAGGAVTRFVMDTNSSLPNLLAETDAANAVQRYYLHSPYGLVEQIDAAGNPRFYHFDPSGNTLALTNAAGQVSDAYAYTPFGETTANGATVNPFRFVGQYGVRNFNGTPLHDMRARWYAADRARFMSLDPLLGDAERPQSLNRYAYVEGNPVVRIDASGLSPTTITYDSFQIYLENEPSNFFKRWIYWYGVRKNLKASEEELSSAMKKFLDSRDLVDLMLMWLMTSNKPPQTFLPRTILKSIDKIKGKKATDDDKKKYFNKGISVYLDPQVQGAEGNCTDSSFAENFSDICARYK